MKLKVLFHKKGHLDFITVSKGKNRSVNHWAKTKKHRMCKNIKNLVLDRGKPSFGRGCHLEGPNAFL